MKLLRWDPEREDAYIDCEAESVEALPSDVPPGSCCKVRQDGSFWLMMPDGSWEDVTAVFTEDPAELERKDIDVCSIRDRRLIILLENEEKRR